MIIKRNRIIKTLICFCIIWSSQLNGQQLELVLDTIYTGNNFFSSKNYNSSYLFNHNSFVIIDKEGIKRKEWKIENSTIARDRENLIIEMKGKSYIVQKDYNLLPSEGLDFKISQIKKGSILLLDSSIVYQSNDSIFIDDLKQPNNKKFIAQDLYVLNPNQSKIITLKNEDRHFLYNIQKGQFDTLNHETPFLKINNHLIVLSLYTGMDTYNTKVFDLDWNLLFETNKYSAVWDINCYNDYLVFNSESAPPLFFFKKKQITLPKNIVEISSIRYGLFRVKNNKGLFGLINSKGEIIHEIKYSEIAGNEKCDFISLFENNEVKLLNETGDIFFNGSYKELDCIDKNLFSVKKGVQRGVVNEKNKIIVPFEVSLLFFTYQKINAYGHEIIVKRNAQNYTYYDMQGRKITNWNTASDGGDEFSFDPKQFFWVIGKSSVKKLNQEDRSSLNPYNAWISKKMINKKIHYRFENSDVQPLTEWFSMIQFTKLKGLFIIKTKSGKYGAIRIKN